MHTRILLADRKVGQDDERRHSADAFAALPLSAAHSLAAVIATGEIA